MKRFAWTWPIMLAGSTLLAFGMLPDRPDLARVSDGSRDSARETG